MTVDLPGSLIIAVGYFRKPFSHTELLVLQRAVYIGIAFVRALQREGQWV